MRAMVLERQREPLRPAELPDPEPAPGQVLISVARLRRLPHRPAHRRRRADRAEAAAACSGHQIVGTVAALARAPSASRVGERVGVPWLGWTDGECRYCLSGRENLCDRARFTGYDLDGGYAELTRRRRALLLPDPRAATPTEQAAPLLCAGLIGYRALRLVGDAERIGLYGFGASAHIICQVARARRAGGSSPSPARATRRRRRSRASSAPSGPAPRRTRRPRSSTRRSSSPRSARWCRRRCGPAPRARGWSAPAST